MNEHCLANPNTLWGGVIVEVLENLGVEYAVVSPGSRSTPLTFALGLSDAIQAIPVLDERSAAFFALGLAKRSHRPVVLVCTSGTAAANYLPAIIEARYSHVPLLVLTADRPPELRECSAGQTIDQVKLYGNYVNGYSELALPEATEAALSYLRQTLLHAFHQSLAPAAGPVHLNVPFRDPLAPEVIEGSVPMDTAWLENFLSEVSPTHPLQSELVELPMKRELLAASEGVIIAGSVNVAEPEKYAQQVKDLSDALGWPVLCDVLSPIRHYAGNAAHLIKNYDLILREKSSAKELQPSTVLCLGPLPTSKVLRQWLGQSEAVFYFIDQTADNLNPLHTTTVRIDATLPQVLKSLQGSFRPLSSYAKEWMKLEAKVTHYLQSAWSDCDALLESKVSWLLSKHLPEQTPLFVANSMPIRDAEFFWEKSDRGYEVYFSRGANGIDGTLSTALGVAFQHRPSVLFTGDLALLHDSNGFLVTPYFKGSLTIVLINNEGGGIFENLPIARYEPPFEDYFATPQKADFGKLAAAHGVDYHCPKSIETFLPLIQTLPAKGIRLIELKTHRKRDKLFRDKLLSQS